MNRDGDHFLEGCNDLGNIKWSHDTCHILQTEGIGPHVLDLFPLVDIIFQIKHITTHTSFS